MGRCSGAVDDLHYSLFTLACCLIWSIAADYSLPVATCLLALMLANSEVLFAFGNAAGVAISLCAIAVWCFYTGRFAFVGVVFLAASLAIKPHDSAAVWLYLLIAGGAYRKRAVQVADRCRRTWHSGGCSGCTRCPRIGFRRSVPILNWFPREEALPIPDPRASATALAA